MKQIWEAENNWCPCCGSLARRVNIAVYSEFACDLCDHVWFETKSDHVSNDIYEDSAKYQEYYVGKPPRLWYHGLALDYLLRHKPQGRVLDFGCFDGFFVKRMRDAGIDAYGCDWNRKAVETGIETFQLGGRLSRNPDGRYDAIVALEVIEHFEKPQDFIEVVRPHLAHGAPLILSCPNKNSLYRPRTDAPPHHFSRFSRSSLRHLLERNGFQVLLQEHEMSSFQMMRNLLGDLSRSKSPTLGKDSEFAGGDPLIRNLKHLANRVSGFGAYATKPIDTVMHALGFAYISQFAVGTFKNGK